MADSRSDWADTMVWCDVDADADAMVWSHTMVWADADADAMVWANAMGSANADADADAMDWADADEDADTMGFADCASWAAFADFAAAFANISRMVGVPFAAFANFFVTFAGLMRVDEVEEVDEDEKVLVPNQEVFDVVELEEVDVEGAGDGMDELNGVEKPDWAEEVDFAIGSGIDMDDARADCADDPVGSGIDAVDSDDPDEAAAISATFLIWRRVFS